MTYPSRNSEMPLVGSPLQIISGPLSSPDSITAPQHALERSQARRNRLFYPALALLVLILLALVAGGAYYFTRANNTQVVSSSLSQAQGLVTRAQNELNRNPSLALTDLATAQKSLQNVKSKYQLDASQSQTFSRVQTDLVSTTKKAIIQYNKAANITLLSCVNPVSHAINNTSTHTQVQSIFPVVNTKGALTWYAYSPGQSGGVYLLNPQNSLVSSLANTNTTSILSLSSNGSYLIALTERVVKNQTLSYAVSTYQPDQNGKLTASPPVPISSATTNSLTPMFITSWKSNVYVVLASSSQDNQNNVRVLSYLLDAKGHLDTPKAFDFAVSYPPIVSAAAFPDQKLFLLESNGSILNFVEAADVKHQSVPGNVEVDASVAAPLSVAPQDFKAGETVPVAASSVLPNNGPLTVTGISPTSVATLAAGQVNNVTHLYVGDSYNHRVLDLVVNPTVIAGGPTPAPTASSTPAANGQSVNFHLVHQFVSSNTFTQVKSVALQPNSSHLNVLAQDSSGQNLVSFDTAAQSTCPS